MKNDLVFNRTTLSKSDDVVNTLEYKMNSLQEQDLPIQEGISDYIGLALDEIDAQLQQLKVLKQDIANRERTLKSHSDSIKEDGAKFFEKYGIEKMEGNMVSSVTIIKPKNATVKQVFVTNLTAKEKEALIFDAGLGHYEDKEVEGTKAKLKVNKRRVLTPEIEDAN